MEGLKQSTLDFSKGAVRISSRSPSLDSRPSPEAPSTNKHSKRKPVTQSFDHGKHRQQDDVSDGQEVSESEEEVKLETSRGRKQGKVASDDSQSETEDEESEEVDSEAMLDLEASDDEDYQSGDSLDEDEGGNRRRKKKDRGKRKRRESTEDSDIEVVEPTKKVDKGKKRRVVVSDEDDIQIIEQPVASTSRATTSQTPLSPSRPTSRSIRPLSSFLGVEVPPRSNSKSPTATPIPKSPSKSTKKSSKSKLAPTNDSEDSDSPPPRLPSSRTRKSQGKRRAIESSTSGSSSEFEEPESLRKDRKKRQKRSRADSSTSPKKKTKRSKKKKPGKLSQGVRDRRSADESSESEGESESNFFVVDDDVEESSEWSESERERLLGPDQYRKNRRELEEIRERDKEEVRRKRLAAKEKGKGKAKAIEPAEEDEDDEDEPVRSGRRTQNKGKGKAKETKSKSKSKKGKSKRVVEESEGSEEDEEDLGIDGEETVVDQRLRTTKSSTANKFEQLRAARQNKLGSSSQAPIVIDSSNEGSSSPAPARRTGPRYAGGSDSDQDESEDDSATSEQDQSQHDVDSDDFIASDGEIEDDEEAQRELEKIRSRAQGFNYYLKNYLLYLVHLIVVPEADWLAADPEFRDAQEKVEGRLQGIVSSGVSSGGWKPDFKAVVDARPQFVYEDLTGLPPCDACSAGEHRRAVFVGTFSGPRYNRKTLQPIESSDEESSSSSSSSCSDDDSTDQDKNHPLDRMQKTSTRKNKKKNRKRKDRDQEFTFNLGRFCAGRCITYHQLQHWNFEARQKVARKVLPLRDSYIKPAKKKKGMTAEEWLQEQRRARRAREKDASRIGEILDRKGVIKQLADTIEAQLERAINDFSS